MGKTLFGSFDYINQAPAFVFAERAGFHNPDGVSDIAFVFLVVSHKFGGLFNKLPVLWVFHFAFHHNDYGLVHLVAHDNTDSFFS